MDIHGLTQRMPAGDRVRGEWEEGKGFSATGKRGIGEEGALVEFRDQWSWEVWPDMGGFER